MTHLTNSNRPIITVFLPVYNGSAFLGETIDSILKQSFADFELICVDDSSTDDSYQILQTFASSDSRVRLFQKPNGGTVAKSYNYALPYMQGDYVFYSSQDDLMHNTLLEKMYVCAKQTKADGVHPNMAWYQGENDHSQGIFSAGREVISGREAASLSIDWTIHGFILWKLELVKKIKYFDFGLFSDEYTVRVLFLNSKTIAFCDGLFYYRQNNPNAITKKISLPWFDKLETSKRLRKLFHEQGSTTEENAKLAMISFQELIHSQFHLLQHGSQLSPQDLISAKNKIKQAYQDLENIKEIKARLRHRILCTKGYRLFSFYIWLELKLKKLLKKAK